MAAEIIRTPETKRALPPNIQTVASGISSAAKSQPKELIDHAIQSFKSIQEKQLGTDELFRLLGDTSAQAAGHVDHPLKYFTYESGIRKHPDHNSIVSMNDVLSRLRNQSLHFHQGISSFLRSGVQESLASLKISSNPGLTHPPVPTSLDELISTEKLRNPDRDGLQVSLQIMNEMFSTLKSLQSDVTDLRVNMMRSIRA